MKHIEDLTLTLVEPLKEPAKEPLRKPKHSEAHPQPSTPPRLIGALREVGERGVGDYTSSNRPY